MIPTQADSREPDARQHLERWSAFAKRVSRYWPTVLIALLVGTLCGASFLMLRKPQYRSETVILYVEQGSPIGTSDNPDTPRNVTVRLKELLLSRPKLEQIVSSFDLYPAMRRKYGPLEAVEELKRHIDFRAPGGDTFSIAFEGNSPKEAQNVTAELARVVLQGDSELRSEQARVALDFLATERQQTEAQLRETEQKLAAFMAKHPRFALDATPLTNGAAIRASLGGAGAAANPTTNGRAAWVTPRSRVARPIASTTTDPVSTDSAPSAVVQDLDPGRARAALAAARESLAESSNRYTAAHPDVRAARAAVERAEQRLETAERSASQIPTVPTALVPEVTTKQLTASEAGSQQSNAGRRAPSTQGGPGQGAVAGSDLVEMETEWLNLTRAVTEARQRHDRVEAQLFKADILVSSEGGGHGVQVNVIDPAYLPQRPLPPGRTTIVLMFIGGSLLIGMAIAMGRATFDDRVLRGTDLDGMAEILVEVPKTSTMRRAHGTS
jgi:uncharacterized protein involved in exopolysaccharide biosynthesis